MAKTEDLTRDLVEMMRLASKEEGLEDLLHFGLEWVRKLAPADLTTIFRLEGDQLVVKAADGRLVDDRVRNHQLRLKDFPSIQRTLQANQARAFTEADHAHGDGDPFDDVLDFPPGHSCMVVPLKAGDKALGIMTLDRAVCEPYSEETVQLLEIYGHVLALAIAQTEQTELLRRLHRDSLARERLLNDELSGSSSDNFENAEGAAMRNTVAKARQVAQTHTPVLILGETGTGKEYMAAAIHQWSPRAKQPFLKINCAAIPENLLESELFGHVKGAFTGAVQNRPGRFQMANGGTLLLDEIGEMPINLQAKLLRVLQEGTFEPVGSDRTVKVDVRILAATHQDLAKAITEKRFREDLYYRLSVFPLHMPPLRERLGELPKLCGDLLANLARRTGRGGLHVTEAGMRKLAAYPWPGNIRELSNVLERAAILSRDKTLGPEVLDLPKDRLDNHGEHRVKAPVEPMVTLDEAQRRHIIKALAYCGGKIYGEDGAAAVLDMKPSTLQSRMKKLGIEKQVSYE